MVDKISQELRSKIMGKIRGKNTKPEVIVRRLLFRLGYRFRIHYKKLPGRPDVALPKYRAAIFVHGCFWHQHPGCVHARIPRTRPDFWASKFERNRQRDARYEGAIHDLGWRCIVIWECETENSVDLERRLRSALAAPKATHK